MDLAFVVSNVEVEDAAAGAAGEVFGYLLGEGRYARLGDGDRVEGFEGVD